MKSKTSWTPQPRSEHPTATAELSDKLSLMRGTNKIQVARQGTFQHFCRCVLCGQLYFETLPR